MKNEWNIRVITEDDIDDVLSLIRTSMGEGPIPREKEFWIWKHFKNPFGISPALAAEVEGKMIGLRVFMRWRWKSRDIEIQAVRAVDTATHPDWRGKRIFTELTSLLKEEMKKQGVSFIYNTPNQSSLPGYLKMGWKKVAKVPLWIRPLKLFHILSWILNRRRRETILINGLNLQTPEAFLSQPDVTDFLTRSAPSEDRYHTNRTIDYLKWRYVEIPGFSYSSTWQFEKREGAASIFRERSRKGLHELSISELICTPGNHGIRLGQLLMDQLVRKTKADYIVASAASNTLEETILKRSGFFPLHFFGPVFSVHVLDSTTGLKTPELWSNWRCTIGDLEIF